MTRAWLRRSAICLIIGLAITTAIAWCVGYVGVAKKGTRPRYFTVGDHVAVASIESGAAIDLIEWQDVDSRNAAWAQYAERNNANVVYSDTDVPPPLTYDSPGNGPRWASFWTSDGTHTARWRTRNGSGLAACGVFRDRSTDPGKASVVDVVWRPRDSRLTAIPIRPVLPGLIVDTLLWGLASGLAWTCGFALVRPRGPWMCPSCGYYRRGLAADAKCPECGTVPAPAAK